MNTVGINLHLFDEIFFVYLIANISHFLNASYRKSYIITDLMIALLIGLIGAICTSINLIIWIIGTLIYQKLRYKKLNYRSLNNRLFSIMLVLTASIISMSLTAIINFVTVHFINFKLSNDLMAYMYISLYSLLSVSCCLLIYRFKRGVNSISEKINRLKLEPQIFKILAFLLVTLVTILSISQIAQITKFIAVPLLIFFFIFVCFALFQGYSFIQAYSYRQEAESQLIQNRQLKDYLSSIEQQYEEMRHFKHDYNNMLLALEEFTKKDQQQEFKAYYQQLVQQNPTNIELQSWSIGQLENIHNEPIKGLIIQKFLAAQKQGLQFKLEINESITINTSDILSIVRIIGILLDNAIEHTVQEKEKTINCAFIKNNKSVEITISNPATKQKNLDQIFKNGYTTKMGHQGFGLANVKELVEEKPYLFLENKLVNNRIDLTLIIMTGEK